MSVDPASLIVFAILFVASAVLSNTMIEDYDVDDDISSGLHTNTRSTEEALPIVYGTTKIGGNDVFIATSGDNNKILWIVQTLAEGPCGIIKPLYGVEQVWLGDQLYTEFGGNVEYWYHRGSAAQAVDSNLNAAFSEWTDCLSNTTYIVWKLTYDENYFQSVPKRLVELRGKLLYDFRNDKTAYENNPVLCLYDYLTNSRYGLGFDSAKIDVTSWTSAANYCDTKGWEFNGAFTDIQPAQDIVDAICSHFRGHLVWYDGIIYLRYADTNYESSSMTLEDKHIVQNPSGDAQISISQPSRFKRPDAMRVTYIDPDKDYVSDSVMIGDSNGQVQDLKLIGCTSRQMACDLGVYYLERAQLDRTVSGLFRDDALKLEAHDLVTFNADALGISDETMRVVEAEIQNDGLIALSLQYEDDTLYDDDYNFNADSVYTCSLPDPNATPPNVSTPTLTETTYNYRLRTFTRLEVDWSFATDYPWLKHIEVWVSFDNDEWEHLFNVTDDFFIDPVEEGTRYYLNLKTVSIWGQKSTGTKVSKSIVGDVDPPDSISSLTASVNENTINLWAKKLTDPDIELYEFRIGTSWNGAVHLASLRSPNLSLDGVKPAPSGGYVFWCNTLGSNGVYGDTPRSASVSDDDLVDPPDGWTNAGIDSTEDYL